MSAGLFHQQAHLAAALILMALGMPLIRFDVEFKDSDSFTALGKDIVMFLFSANSSSALQPLSDVASGGEMARVMLAIKSLVAGKVNQPTLIFDEIDTGISGVLAERMGRMMQKMGMFPLAVSAPCAVSLTCENPHFMSAAASRFTDTPR